MWELLQAQGVRRKGGRNMELFLCGLGGLVIGYGVAYIVTERRRRWLKAFEEGVLRKLEEALKGI